MSLIYEHEARIVMADRLAEAEHRRLVRRAKSGRSRSVRVFDLGSVVVAWRPRRRPLDAAELRRDTPVVIWM